MEAAHDDADLGGVARDREHAALGAGVRRAEGADLDAVAGFDPLVERSRGGRAEQDPAAAASGALDLLGCMCSGLDLTTVVAPLLEMVMPTIAEVETDDSLNKLTLYEIIHKAQTAVSGFMAPTLLCSASCKSSAGNVLHLAFEAARFFLSDANQNPASDLVDLPTFPFPPLPADLNDDVDASRVVWVYG